MTNNYCSIANAGLQIYIDNYGVANVQSCCLRDDWLPVDNRIPLWEQPGLVKLRSDNLNNSLDSNCNNICGSMERNGIESFRSGMNKGLVGANNVAAAGPRRLDLMFNSGCNLACRICPPTTSSYWRKYLADNGLPAPLAPVLNTAASVIELLSTLNLSELQMVIFCGGETLLGDQCWQVVRWLAENDTVTKSNLTIAFQTNGTQPISDKYYNIIEKFKLVKLHFSIDGVGPRFNYLRWPADWSQVVKNIINLKNTLPSNVMLLVEETLSIFNLPYYGEVSDYVAEHFPTNREGDETVVTCHKARDIFGLDRLTSEYVEYLIKQKLESFVPLNWTENTQSIRQMVEQVQLHDRIRGQQWSSTFPESAKFYVRYM